MAIKIKVKKAPKKYDLAASKFFGSPAIPNEWVDDFDEDVIFFCQIRLADIAAFDKENKLPHTGYLYIFLDTYEGAYALQPIVRYYGGEPNTVLEDFNLEVTDYERFNEAWLMEFEETDDEEICTRLFGVPSDWNYEDEPPKLLMQYDPLDNDMDFLDYLDGFIYFFFGEDEKDLRSVYLKEEYT